MPVRLVTPKELNPDENRVALVPDVATRLKKLGIDVVLESGAGDKSYFPDNSYKDAEITSDNKLYDNANLIIKVGTPGEKEIDRYPAGSVLISFINAHQHKAAVKKLAEKKITCLAMELIPRISRAQSMDALSSQASIAGYKSALMAADISKQFFPMLTTAAGTIRPAKVLIIGAGVAGLQAIATCKRLGAMVEAYDVRSITKEQVESLGAKFVELAVNAEAEGGYARELTDDEKQEQRKLLGEVIGRANIVITTAAIPGKTSPKLIFREAVESMKPGSVIIDLASEGGGNCELTEPGQTIEHQGVTIHAPLNVASMIPIHASEMYSKNLLNLIQIIIKDGELHIDANDDVIKGCLLCTEGEVVHPKIKEILNGAVS